MIRGGGVASKAWNGSSAYARRALRPTEDAAPPTLEAANMRRLRADLHQRMLDNGYCTRTPERDCLFETICETCTHFNTTPPSSRQRNHAAGED